MATIELGSADPAAAPGDAVVIGVVKEGTSVRLLPAPGVEELADAFDGGMLAVLQALGATGAEGEVTRIPTLGRATAPVVVAVGVGQARGRSAAAEDVADSILEAEALRRAAGAAVRALAGTRRVALALPAADAEQARAVAEGALLGAYAFTRFRSSLDGVKAPVEELVLLGAGENGEAVLDRARTVVSAVHLTRDLVNTPPSHLHPAELADAAVAAAQEVGLEVEVLDEEALRAGGYGGILGVGQGSVHPPRLVVVRYTPENATRSLALVGKGITFDSGGISLKPAQSMEWMKCDMGGAAAVLSAITAIARLQLPVKVTAWAALAENMPSGSAQRPSDVLTIRGGKTVEVLNTDAEGRLVLADALVDAAAEEPDLIVDVATLTGAQLVALGSRTAGIMSNDDATRAAVHAAATRAGEAMWPMPLPAELRKSMDSPVADIANMGDRYGGMLVAGLFLKEFVGDERKWAHLDIAGPAWNEGEAYGYTPKQGTGAAVRTLVQVAEEMATGAFAG